MSAKSTTTSLSSSAHVVLTALLGIVVTALSCFAFYVFRSMTSRELSFTNAMKVIRSSTEIVAALAERAIPSLRGRVDELESRGRVLEQHQRKFAAELAAALTAGGGAGGTSSIPGGITPATVPGAGGGDSEAALLTARRAARTQHQVVTSEAPGSSAT